jgi:hypothetical protein
MRAVRACQTAFVPLVPVNSASNGEATTLDKGLCHRAAGAYQEPAERLTGNPHAPRRRLLRHSLEVCEVQRFKLFDLENARNDRFRRGSFRKEIPADRS